MLEVREVAIDGGDGQDAFITSILNETVPRVDAAVDPDLIPFFGMTDIVDGNVIVLAPEEWYGVEAFVLAEHVARCGLALPLGYDPMLNPDI